MYEPKNDVLHCVESVIRMNINVLDIIELS